MEMIGSGAMGGNAAVPSYQSEAMARMPSLKQRLDCAVKDAESRLADAKRAREILDAHPELEDLMNIMQRGRF